jgi:hypothetical protein
VRRKVKSIDEYKPVNISIKTKQREKMQLIEPKSSSVPKLHKHNYVFETGGDILNVLANLLKANKKSRIISPNR